MGQENVASSPLEASSPAAARLSSRRPRRPPTVTPKRFNRFFTPRNRAKTGGRQSKAGRQLRDITANGINRRKHTALVKDELSKHLQDERSAIHSPKRRKLTAISASSPLQSSPLKHVEAVSPIRILEDEPFSPPALYDDDLPTLKERPQSFPVRVRTLRRAGRSDRILERSFGGYSALNRMPAGSGHCANWQAETANFVSTPDDIHSFRPGSAVPFCTTSCNANSLVAVGDEEGNVRLIDSAASSDFAAAYLNFRVHRNAIMDIAFNSNDLLLATASGDQTARVSDMRTQQVLCVLAGHTSSVKQVRFQPMEDNLLTTSGRDSSVQIWDLRCSGKGSVQSLQPGQRRGLDEDGIAQPSQLDDAPVSVTAFQHLRNGSSNLLVTGSELDASLKLWDLRNASRRDPIPLSATELPKMHRRTRNYGICSIELSGDGARIYALCKDATVYAYSTTQLLAGQSTDVSSNWTGRRPLKDPTITVEPLYGYRHALPGGQQQSLLAINSFYVKLALRPAQGDRSEMLAVGNTDRCPIVFPTDERYLPLRPFGVPGGEDTYHCDGYGYDSEPPDARDAPTSKGSFVPRIYERGTALLRGHSSEVTSVAWTHEGDLVTVGDDFTARCWREDAEKARELRACGEGGGRRWGHGWADAEARWDEEDG
ncbi:hypothetical protein BAUCODRAFT_66216 [Baudoinia panamericana UAMH 10762]|uniref:Anaphase-promoting complex subunit 4 WD40 domain-containing protein n=1 Tax=Baudoinia panamericana (strain UAMH 10762) TaxID=717646 RepID=M2N2M8_BAUPA|nr:uncharacterized protein BAUCODRAFT_66216 [Baudoinia panamericana UAMH 10762]EMC98193.1 hypothetical protein BAUCODRAFT_66216 [Baudoinia panamericana UAMH 10762]